VKGTDLMSKNKGLGSMEPRRSSRKAAATDSSGEKPLAATGAAESPAGDVESLVESETVEGPGDAGSLVEEDVVAFNSAVEPVREESGGNSEPGGQPNTSAQKLTARKDKEMAQPFIVDLGSVSRGEAKRLKRGTGEKLQEALRAAQDAKTATPDAVIVVLYRKKKRRNRSLFPFPFSPPR
jgi:hypothetical protein